MYMYIICIQTCITVAKQLFTTPPTCNMTSPLYFANSWNRYENKFLFVVFSQNILRGTHGTFMISMLHRDQDCNLGGCGLPPPPPHLLPAPLLRVEVRCNS